jgi:hypothetical protein
MFMQSLREPESSGSSSPAGERRVIETTNRERRRRSAVEPVIGYLKADHSTGRNIERNNARLCALTPQLPC